MHWSFWKYLIQDQLAPAEALFAARADYLQDVLSDPAADPGLFNRAVGFKTWRQFTCLGLGW